MKQETLNRPPRLFKTNQDKEEFVFWIETLKARVLPQGKHRLQSSDGYCCLGIGVVCTVEKDNLNIEGSTQLLFGDMPRSQPHAPEWLQGINQHSDRYYNYYISNYNDHGEPHPEIAEKLWQLYKWELED